MIIQTEDLVKVYGSGITQVTALKTINLKIEKGEFVAIMGASGSGKSTLLNVLGCLDKITSGRYLLDGIDVSSLGDDKLASVRNKKIGFVFQAYNLLPKLTAAENVILPMLYSNAPSRKWEDTAKAALKKVGLDERMNHKPKELSGGQNQRVAIARALINNPSIILADEPTGNLDSKAGSEIISIFQNLNDEGTTILMVTHDAHIASHAKRVIYFKDGSIQSDAPVEKRIIEENQPYKV